MSHVAREEALRQRHQWFWDRVFIGDAATLPKVMIYGKSKNTDRGGRTRCRAPQPRENWMTVEMPELRIVDDDLWNAAQARRRAHQQHTTAPIGARVSSALLSGLATCTICDGPITILGSRQRERSARREGSGGPNARGRN